MAAIDAAITGTATGMLRDCKPRCRKGCLLVQLGGYQRLAMPLEHLIQVEEAVQPQQQQALLQGGYMQHQPDQSLLPSQVRALCLDQRPRYALKAQGL